MLRADEFPLDEKVTLNRTGLRRVRLVFGAVSRHDSTVDLLEPDGYRIEGIRLEAVRRPAGKLRCRIEGEVVDRPQSSLLLLYAFTESGSQMSDPEALIPIREGRFTYDLDLDTPDYYQLVFADEEMRGSFLPVGFIADACGVRMTLYPEDEGLERNRIGGGALNDELDGYQARLRRLSEPYGRAMDSLYRISAAFIPEAQRLVDCMADRSISAERRREASRRYMQLFRSGEAYGPEFRRLMAGQQTAQRRYLDSLLAGEPTLPRLVLLAEAIVRKRGEAYKPLFEQRYATAFADHPLVRFCAERLAAETVREGMPYVDFSAPDLDGKERRVSELVAWKTTLPARFLGVVVRPLPAVGHGADPDLRAICRSRIHGGRYRPRAPFDRCDAQGGREGRLSVDQPGRAGRSGRIVGALRTIRCRRISGVGRRRGTYSPVRSRTRRVAASALRAAHAMTRRSDASSVPLFEASRSGAILRKRELRLSLPDEPENGRRGEIRRPQMAEL